MKTSTAVAFSLLLGMVLLQAVTADLTKCQKQSQKPPGDSPPRIGAFIPQCDKKGNYKPQQCDGSTGYCWCVNANGDKIPGSETRPGEPKKNCDDNNLIYVCPAFNSSICITAKPGKPQCGKDSDCSNNEKCCCVNCGLKCVIPQKVKPGRCPKMSVKCMKNVNDTCSMDSDCPNEEKCCKVCGKCCWKPDQGPRGVCPKNDQVKSKVLNCRSVECIQDSDCKFDEHCCAYGDGKKCLKPVKEEKTGECPPPKTACFPVSTKVPKPKCSNDFDCPGKQKCCISLCTPDCTNPLP